MNNNKKTGIVYLWLLTSCFLVFIMVFIGGLTRLTDSGLSMVEWNLISGILPPLNENNWIILFEKYKQFPEFKIINPNINLDEFKFIFWMEYIQRVWGRIIFLFFLIPLIFFIRKKYIQKKLQKHFFIILILIMLQGLFGWYMVQSGLVEKPDVSHYRLSVHLTIAFIIYGYLLLLTFYFYDIKKNKKKIIIKNKNFSFFIFLCSCLILLTVFSGGMVAGLDAGLVYNTFPLMGEKFFPTDFFDLDPNFINFFENPVSVQFDHRILGISTALLTFYIWFYSRKKNLQNKIKKKVSILLTVVLIQISLGIATLLSYVATPIAITHQLGALIVFSISLWIIKDLPFVSK